MFPSRSTTLAAPPPALPEKTGNILPVSLLYRFVGDEVTSLNSKEKLETPHVVSCHHRE
jgi:hypothetical protein